MKIKVEVEVPDEKCCNDQTAMCNWVTYNYKGHSACTVCLTSKKQPRILFNKVPYRGLYPCQPCLDARKEVSDG